MEDYEIVCIVKNQLDGLIRRGDKMMEAGQNLSDVKIQMGVHGGVYSDFRNVVTKIKQLNEKHKFGCDSDLMSLEALDIGNWSELVGECTILLPIVKQFLDKLRPPSGKVGGYDVWSP